jgi:hypothetical protein
MKVSSVDDGAKHSLRSTAIPFHIYQQVAPLVLQLDNVFLQKRAAMLGVWISFEPDIRCNAPTARHSQWL